MIEVVATREFSCVSPAGEKFSLTVQLGCPTRVDSQPDSDWRCAVTIPFDGRIQDIYGVDSWQALHLAMSLVNSLLADFIRRGGKLYHPGTTEEFTLDAFPHGTGTT